MAKLIRKFAAKLAAHEDPDNRRSHGGLFVNAVENERTHLDNITRAFRSR